MEIATASSSAAAVTPQPQSIISSSSRSASKQSPASDEAAARSLARSWKVEGLQSTLLENRGQMHPSSSRTKLSPAQTQSTQSQPDKKPSVSKASTSQNVPLPASSFASSSSSASTVVAAADSHHSRITNSTLHHTPSSVNVVPSSSQLNSSTHSRSRSQSQSQSQSRAPPAQGAQPSHLQTRVELRPGLPY